MAGNRVRWVALSVVAAGALGMSAPGLPVLCVGEMAHAQQVAATTGESLRDGQRVTVNVENMPLLTVLQTIAQQAGLVPMYDATLIPSQRRVSLHVREISASDAFEQALRGTGLVAQIHAKGQVVILRGTSEQVVAGGVTGMVRDSATKQPINDVTVTLSGTRYAARTGTDGRFRLAGVPAGTYRLTVRRIGYRSATVSVQVTDDAAATVSVSLMPANTELSEVVTTAVGQQRRLEVGNVIAHLNVDSIAKTAPVTSVTDLLSARAPGVQVVENSGLVGAGASIRIRGQSSMALASDPIIIVDGVRQDNTPGGTSYNTLFGNVPTPSRINDIDVNQIETIDILKGPAASTEYGTDAANGVIVITTKKGKIGAPIWHVSGEHGWSEIPTGFPDFYYAYGHTTDGTNRQVLCNLTNAYNPNVGDSTCVIDSVVHDNPLNHKATSLYGTGARDNVNADVSGGSDAARYFVGANMSHDLGTTQLPSVFHSLATTYGYPSSVFDPNSQNQTSARANVDARLSATTELTVNGAYMSTRQSDPLGGSGLSLRGVSGPVVLDSAHNWGYGTKSSTPLYSLGTQQTELTKRATGGVTLDWRPESWFAGHLTGGIDHGAQRAETFQPASLFAYASDYPDAGTIYLTNTTTDITSVDTRGSVTFPLSPSVRSVTSFGLQTTQTTSQGLVGSASGNVTQTNPTLNGTPDPAVQQSGTGSATVGGYAEEQVALSDRLFLTGALRLDGASGFGGDYHRTAYPKLSASWLAFNRDGSTIRLRGAFGVSGVQPQNGASLQLYQPQAVDVDGSSTSSSLLTSPGNPNLKPERSQETEGGIDIGLLDSRVNVELTAYTKHTKDALTSTSLGMTLGNLTWQENIGDVKNSGVEATLQAVLVQTAATTWSVTLNTSKNSNKLLHLAPGVIGVNAGGSQQFVVGYPLYGYWAPKATFSDANHDGIIETSEVQIEDTSSYMGSSLPKLETSLSNQIGLFHGALSIGALFDARSGDVIDNLSHRANNGTLYEQNMVGAPLWEQARAVAGTTHSQGTSLNYEDGWFIRFQELSLTYNVPSAWLHGLRTRTLSVTTAVRNLGLWSHYTGADPQVGKMGAQYDNSTQSYEGNADLRYDYGGVPLSRTWVLRVNLGL